MDSFGTSGVEGGADVGDESPRHCRRFRPARPLEVADQGAADDHRVGDLGHRASGLREYKDIMVRAAYYVDHDGYYCTSRAQAQCPRASDEEE